MCLCRTCAGASVGAQATKCSHVVWKRRWSSLEATAQGAPASELLHVVARATFCGHELTGLLFRRPRGRL
jgi:hypothetical protein